MLPSPIQAIIIDCVQRTLASQRFRDHTILDLSLLLKVTAVLYKGTCQQPHLVNLLPQPGTFSTVVAMIVRLTLATEEGLHK